MPGGGDTAADVKGITDAVLSCASLLGIPPVTLGAQGAKLLIDLGFAWFFHETEARLREAQTAALAGDAAAAASNATHAREVVIGRIRAALAVHELQMAVERCTCGRWSLDLDVPKTLMAVRAAWIDHMLEEVRT